MRNVTVMNLLIIVMSGIFLLGCTQKYAAPIISAKNARQAHYNNGNETSSSTYVLTDSSHRTTHNNITSHNTAQPMDIYVVQAGDMLSSVAPRYGVSYQQLAEINQLAPPYVITVGQRLRVPAKSMTARTATTTAPTAKTRVSTTSTQTSVPVVHNDANRQAAPSRSMWFWRNNSRAAENKTTPVKISQPTKQAAIQPISNTQPEVTKPEVTKPKVTPAKVVAASAVATPSTATTAMAAKAAAGLSFSWPIVGKVVRPYSGKSGSLQSGIVIEGQAGQDVYAAVNGKVVYSGVDIKGGGQMLIVDSGNGMISAYSRIEEVSVKEQQEIKQGQPIAILGHDNLLFEIRQNGKPLNPLDYLPQK